jgi:hypothetical protein
VCDAALCLHREHQPQCAGHDQRDWQNQNGFLQISAEGIREPADDFRLGGNILKRSAEIVRVQATAF